MKKSLSENANGRHRAERSGPVRATPFPDNEKHGTDKGHLLKKNQRKTYFWLAGRLTLMEDNFGYAGQTWHCRLSTKRVTFPMACTRRHWPRFSRGLAPEAQHAKLRPAHC